MKTRLVLILPYYGRLPPYFNAWMSSVCGKCFDVLFVSNLKVASFLPNFHQVFMDLSDLEKLAREKMGVDVNIRTPARLCDFKPMYGHIFEDYIRQYKYWAFGDCDLVYGNLMNRYVCDIVARKFDAASCRKCWSSGSFFMMKNDVRMRMFYTRCSNWRAVAESTDVSFVNFDEIGTQKYYRALERGEMDMEEATHARDCLSAALWRSGDISFSHEDVACEDDLANKCVRVMHDGAVFCGDKELAYFHFIQAKWKRHFFWPEVSLADCKEYSITETGYYKGSPSGLRYGVVSRYRKARALLSASLRKVTRFVKRYCV